jgi:hypothetical protein
VEPGLVPRKLCLACKREDCNPYPHGMASPLALAPLNTRPRGCSRFGKPALPSLPPSALALAPPAPSLAPPTLPSLTLAHPCPPSNRPRPLGGAWR